MKVYVVTLDVLCEDCNSFPGGVRVVGVFATEDKAEEMAVDSYYSIEEMEVDGG